MAWEEPKTDWTAGDVVSKDDFNRIEGNTQYLRDEVDSHKAEDASTTAKGHVRLSNSTSSTSTSLAATASAVKTVNDALTSHKAEDASTTAKGHVRLSSSTSSTSTSLAATASVVKTVNDALTSHQAEKATETKLGHVKAKTKADGTLIIPLSDETAALYGLTGDDATVDNALEIAKEVSFSELPSGWVKIGDIIIQWGYTSPISANLPITFPIAFPVTCAGIFGTPKLNTSGQIYFTSSTNIDLSEITKTGFKMGVNVGGSNPYSIYWIAIGY